MNVNERIDFAKSLGWTDLREVRVFGGGLVLRGFRPFCNAGVHYSVRNDVPMTREEIVILTNQNMPSKISP